MPKVFRIPARVLAPPRINVSVEANPEEGCVLQATRAWRLELQNSFRVSISFVAQSEGFKNPGLRYIIPLGFLNGENRRGVYSADGIDACRGITGDRSPVSRLTAITSCRRSVTAETALRLAKFFGASAAFWVGLQAEHDLEAAQRNLGALIEQEVTALAS